MKQLKKYRVSLQSEIGNSAETLMDGRGNGCQRDRLHQLGSKVYGYKQTTRFQS